MPRPPFGVYVVGDAVVRSGREDRPVKPGESFHPITNSVQRGRIADEELEDLKFVGAAVIKRPQPEIDARNLARTIVGDDAFFDAERRGALSDAMLDELNVVRAAVALPPLTMADLQSAYTTKLDR